MRWNEIMEDTMSHDPRPIDWRDCNLVESIADRLGGVPVLKGTRMPADSIVENYDYGMSPGEIAETFELDVAQVISILEFAGKQRANFA